MSKLKRTAFILLVMAVVLIGSEIGSQLAIPGIHSAIPTSEAIVGRPLTPVSVAGVARRSVRRCAVGVYNC
ncbi:MAG TPA: hypothetical protein VIS57_00940 [Xanthomonadales bacterium]